VLLTEHAVHFVSVLLLDLHAVVGSSRALHVEGNVAPVELTLHARTVLLQAYYALQLESLVVQPIQLHWSLGSYIQARDPRRAADMDPLIESIGIWELTEFKSGFIALNEEVVVIGDLAFPFAFLKEQFEVAVDVIVRLIAVADLILVVNFALEDHGQREGFVFSTSELGLALYLGG
jgi:hypothetical protein